jgi:hypothetical protein
MGIAQREGVQSGAKDDDLPNPTPNRFGQGIFSNPASRSGEQTADAGEGMFGGKLNHVRFVFAQHLQGKRVEEDLAVIE